MSTPQININILIRACYAALRRTDNHKSRLAAAGSPTAQRIYYDALTQADRALELALETGLEDGVVRQCEILQGFCEDSLRSAYEAKFDSYERRVYDRAAAAAADNEFLSDGGNGGDSDSDEESSSADEEGGAPEQPTSSKRLRWAM